MNENKQTNKNVQLKTFHEHTDPGPTFIRNLLLQSRWKGSRRPGAAASASPQGAAQPSGLFGEHQHFGHPILLSWCHTPLADLAALPLSLLSSIDLLTLIDITQGLGVAWIHCIITFLCHSSCYAEPKYLTDCTLFQLNSWQKHPLQSTYGAYS